jgi:acetyltransferase
MHTIDPSLETFFCPRGIAVIGTSSDPGKLGYQIARNLIDIGYSGAVYFVNPRGGELFGKTIYTAIDHVPDPVDVATLLIPAPATPETLRACGERGIRAAIISSGGFRETGTEGARLENELLEIARQYNMRIVGPNCIGLLDTHFPFDTTFLKSPPPPKGGIAFLSHSGATCAAVVDWSRGQGFGFSRLISLGNQMDVNETDMLLTTAADPDTHSLALYLETVSDGRRFVEAARRITREKPVVVLKSGRSASGQKAAASHTGALAGQDIAFDAAFKHAGVIRANTIEELFEWAYTLSSCPLPKGRSMAVLTSAGGLGVTVVDALEAHGLKLAVLAETTRAELKAILPPAASINNPVDMLASATPDIFANCLKLLVDDPNVHGIITVVLPPPFQTDKLVADVLLPVIASSPKPVLTVLVGDQLIRPELEAYHQANVPEFRFPERAVAALAALGKRSDDLNDRPDTFMPEFQVDRAAVRSLISGDHSDKFERLLNAYGIPSLHLCLASDRDAAAEEAETLGFPVVLKIASADLTHKSDVGGVLLNLQDRDAVREGFDLLTERARAARPDAKIDGVTVQRFVPAGQEVIIGTVQDNIFGPMVMFGSGGVEVEGMKDVAFALAPLTRPGAESLLDNTWAGRKLRGYRSIAPADREAVVNVLLRLAQLAHDLPELKELEINPLRVLPVGQGVIALDVRGVSG